jgi:hypothetical protein
MAQGRRDESRVHLPSYSSEADLNDVLAWFCNKTEEEEELLEDFDEDDELPEELEDEDELLDEFDDEDEPLDELDDERLLLVFDFLCRPDELLEELDELEDEDELLDDLDLFLLCLISKSVVKPIVTSSVFIRLGR